MRIANKIIMTLAGLLLIVAAGLKCFQLIDTCVPSWRDNPTGFWESYEFFLIQIPLEFALGIWMVSGLFRKAAWIAGTLAYLGFIFVTIFKVVIGAESCGCFGQITVDPRITLFIMDIPIFLLLVIFRAKGYKLLPPPWPNLFYWFIIFVPTIGLMVLAPAAMVAFRKPCLKPADNQPDTMAPLKLEIYKLKQDLKNQTQEADSLREQLQTSQQTIEQQQQQIKTLQEQLSAQQAAGKTAPAEEKQDQTTQTDTVEEQEPDTESVKQTGDSNDPLPAAEQWDWLQYVVEDDVREQLTQGLVVIMMHRHDCPTCTEMAPKYSDYCAQMTEQGIEEFKIAFLAVPPYHEEEDTVPDDTTCITGKLTDEQKWELMSPYVVALLEGELVKTWEPGTAPEPENILEEVFGE